MKIPKLTALDMWILMTLYNHKNESMTREELENKWNGSDSGLSRKVFANCRKRIRDAFGITIVSKKIQGNYTYCLDRYELEIINKNKFLRWALSVMSTSLVLVDYASIMDRIMLDDIPSSEFCLVGILEAMKHNNVCKMCYQKYDCEPDTLTVKPYFLRQTQGRWYMAAFCEERNAMRVYCLDRIKSFKRTSENFEMPKEPTVTEFFRYSFGPFGNIPYEEAVHIVIRAYGKEAHYMKDCPWHHSQHSVAKGDEYEDFEFFIKPTYDFESKILQHIRSVSVREPAWLCDKIVQALKDALQRKE